MTHQPSALAALQRYATFLNGSGPIDGLWFGDPHPELKGMFWWRVGFEKTIADVLAAWPTQAQGIVTKDMAHHALEVFAEYPEDEPGVDAMFAALESVITHPSPSTQGDADIAVVPHEPTHAMINAGLAQTKWSINKIGHIKCIYKAMIIAAPLYLHPSPSTTALREALREVLDTRNAEAKTEISLHNMQENAANIGPYVNALVAAQVKASDAEERARTLLEGDKT